MAHGINLETFLKLSFLVWKSIIPDLVHFTWYEYVGLAIFAASSIVFSFIDFNHLTDPDNNPSLYNVVNDREAGMEKWRRTLMCVSGAAAFTGVLCVVLTTKGKITCFFWGAINSLLYGLFAYAYGYAGDAQLNLFFFLPMQFVGVYQWGADLVRRESAPESSTAVSPARLTVPQWIVTLALSTGIAFAFYYEIPVFARRLSGVYYFEGQALPHQLDSVSSSLSVVAQTLSVLCYAEQWYYWLAVDAVQIAQFTGVAGYGIVINVLAMWCLFTLNALAGLYAWHTRPSVSADSKLMVDSSHPSRSTGYAAVTGEDHSSDAGGGSGDEEAGLASTAEEIHAASPPPLVDISSCLSTSSLALDLPLRPCTHTSSHAIELTTNPFHFNNGHGGFVCPLEPSGSISGQTGSLEPSSFSSSSSSSPEPARYARGLCVGKFWPFHQGHHFLFQTALRHCHELYIIVCAQPHQHPTGQQRQSCIREAFPHVWTMTIRDDCYDPLDSRLWADLTRAWCGFVPDVVFTSEAYGEAWAAFLGCAHVLVDLPRLQVPISGTAIRTNPFRHWGFLPASTRRVLCRRVVLLGAESTGKTTLCAALAKHWGGAWVAEYGREVCERQLAGRPPQGEGEGEQACVEYTWTDEDFVEIMQVQSQREDHAAMASVAENPHGLVVCDTNCWATQQWYKRYMRRPLPDRLVDCLRSCYTPPTVYVLTSVRGSVFVQDGFRDGEAVREEMEEQFLEALRQQEVPFIVVEGRFEDRLSVALTKLAPFLEWEQACPPDPSTKTT